MRNTYGNIFTLTSFGESHGCVVGIEEKRQDFRNGFPGAFSLVNYPFRKEWIYYLVLYHYAPHHRSESRLQSCSNQTRCLSKFGLQYNFSDRFDR